MTDRDCKTFCIVTLGCRSNQYESAAMAAALEQAGWIRVASARGAALCVVNTCAVTHATEAQCRQMIRRVARENPGCRIAVTGCFAQSAPEDVRLLADGIHVLGNVEKEDIVAQVARIQGEKKASIAVSEISGRKICTTAPCSFFHGRTRALLKIQDGCNSRCAYCIVPLVRGPSRSLPAAEVMERADRLIAAGYREIVLTGIHVGAYGRDLHPRTRLSDLLENLEARCAPARIRIRLSSLEPNECTDELIGAMAASQVICPHVHISLQSGDDDVLRAMRRPYTGGFVERLVERLLRDVPGINIGFDIIAGFPGESDRQFEHTLLLVGRHAVGYAHVFPYSRRRGTAAAQFSGQIPDAVKKERAQALRRLAAVKKRNFLSARIGELHGVLVEGRGYAAGTLRGMTRNYVAVRFCGPLSCVGHETAVRITAARDEYAEGSREDRVAAE